MFYSILRPHPYDIQVEDGEAGGKMTMVAIARGHDENRIVSVVCEMVETEIGGALHWEFSFSIDVFALDGGIEPFRTQERQMAAPFIPDSIRASVMAVVCESRAHGRARHRKERSRRMTDRVGCRSSPAS